MAALVAPTLAGAHQGLIANANDWLWPQLQARITIQTAALTPVALSGISDPSTASQRSVQGGALLGDYVFSAPGFGNFRATSGVLLGGTAGAPILYANPMSKVGVTVLDNALGGSPTDGPSTVPYLGLGYSSAKLWRSVSLSADVGLVAARPAGLSGFGRAILGNQGMETAVRDMRLAPVLQLGMRYSF